MALFCPQATSADIDFHTQIFREIVTNLIDR